MNLPLVTTRRQAYSTLTGLPVDNITAEANPLTVTWRLVTTDVVTGEEAVVHPVNANEEEMPQEETK